MTQPRTVLGAALLLSAALSGACAAESPAPPTATSAAPATPEVIVRDDLRSVFGKAGLRGSFAMVDVASGRTTVVDRARAERRLAPASTFKIAHALIALETGAAKDEDEVIPYGGEPQRLPKWERDMTLGEAITTSNAAIFRTLAHRIGPEKERQWLRRLGYGNGQVGKDIERFWVDGPLKISAVEQGRFLSRFAGLRLPVAKKNLLLVRDMLKVEQKNGYTLYAKTGWSDTFDPQIGWWAGWVENGDRISAFALNLDITTDADAEQRIPLARDLLRALDALP
ncbi:class D beta-lactamase [Nonomuraea sp. NPDC050404]|uniref:class D beta-lactamase n=1 Tax=Nonomuraea sp. NPDC050404 TaxID=3155783 RepID=UPI0033D4A9EC